MEESKTTKAAFWWYRFRSKHKRNVKSLSVSTNGKSPDRFLIVLPEHSTESDLAKRFISSMKNALGPKGAKQMKILGGRKTPETSKKDDTERSGDDD